jgi:hypothetical protein
MDVDSGRKNYVKAEEPEESKKWYIKIADELF